MSLFGLSGPAEDADRLYNESRGVILRLKAAGKTVPTNLENYVVKNIAYYRDLFKKGTYTAEQYNSLTKRAYDYVMPKLKAIQSGAAVTTPGTAATTESVVEGEFNVLGVGIQKKWIVYGGIGLVALIGLSFLKGKK